MGGPSVQRPERGFRLNDAAFAYYPRLQRVRAYVLTHLAEGISLQDGARVAGYEGTYFCAWFHKRAGLPFMKWVRLLKVRQACTMLSSRDCSIAEVAQAVGFRSVRTFERAFRSAMRLSPRAFKVMARPS